MDLLKHILACFIILLLRVFSSSEVIVDTSDYGYGDEDDLSYYDSVEGELNSDDTGFLCDDRKFIVSSYLCDGFWDCDNGADEDPLVCKDFGIEPIASSSLTATTTTPQPIELDVRNSKQEYTPCEKEEFLCFYNQDICVPAESRCDGYTDCPDGEDESHCDISPTVNSPANYFDFDEYNDASQKEFETPSSNPDQVDTNLFHSRPPPSTSGINGFIRRLMNRSRDPQPADPDSSSFRLTHRTPPRKISRVAPFPNPKKNTANLEGFFRHVSDPDEDRVDSTPTGESGRTEASDHFVHLTNMTNVEAEQFLRAQVNVSATKTRPTNHVSSVENAEPTNSNSTLNLFLGPKRSNSRKTQLQKNHKQKLKKLLNKLIRHLGKTLSTSLKQPDSGVKIQISLENQRGFGRNTSKSLEPKITVQLEMNL